MKTAGQVAGLGGAAGLLGLSGAWVQYPSWSWRAWLVAGPVLDVFQVARLMLLVLAGSGVLLLGAAWACDRCSWSRTLSRLGRLPFGSWAVRVAAGAAVAGTSMFGGDASVGASPPPGPAPVLMLESGSPQHGPARPSRPSSHSRSPTPRRQRSTRSAHSFRLTTWEVQPGDNLWSIAEAVLARGADRDPPEQEVALYWLSVIEANRSRLPDPADPSLLFPGDIVVLPPPGRLAP